MDFVCVEQLNNSYGTERRWSALGRDCNEEDTRWRVFGYLTLLYAYDVCMSNDSTGETHVYLMNAPTRTSHSATPEIIASIASATSV